MANKINYTVIQGRSEGKNTYNTNKTRCYRFLRVFEPRDPSILSSSPYCTLVAYGRGVILFIYVVCTYNNMINTRLRVTSDTSGDSPAIDAARTITFSSRCTSRRRTDGPDRHCDLWCIIIYVISLLH